MGINDIGDRKIIESMKPNIHYLKDQQNWETLAREKTQIATIRNGFAEIKKI